MRTASLAVAIAAVAALILPHTAAAQWDQGGVGVSTVNNTQSDPNAIPDGVGGTLLVWQDARPNTHYDIYAQRINALGVPLWTTNGVAVCTATESQAYPKMVADGGGGAIIAWEDVRSGTNYDVYAQRINASGVPQWTANGVALCTAASDQISIVITPDNSGGAIIAWQDYRAGNGDTYAQRVNASGVAQWTANGVGLCTASLEQSTPSITTDNAGGAIVAWYDFRNGNDFNIYAQRVNVSGAVQWTANGVALCVASFDQYTPTIAPDGTGGAIVTWYDYRTAGGADIYAQRVNASGVVQWTADGAYLCLAVDNQYEPTIVSDGAGGAIVAWYDFRNLTDFNIYAQRVDATGTAQWTYDGVPVCTAPDTQQFPRAIADGAGGAYVAWQDFRYGLVATYAQRLSANGIPQWTYDGVATSPNSGTTGAPALAADGAGGVVVAWGDNHSASTDIYAQRIEGNHGYWGHPEPIVASVSDIPNDQGGKVSVNWTASGRDLVVPRTIGYYTIWRAVDVIPFNAATGAAAAPLLLSELGDVGANFSGPVYISVPATASSPAYYWEQVGTQAAHAWPGYTFSASTRADSVIASPGDEFFMVAAHQQYDDFIAFASNAGSGHSVDNLAPSPPLMLVAQRVGADVQLQWNRVHVPDLRDYAVYRATSAGVTPVPGNFLANSADSVLVDVGAPGSALHYIVTALDVHANQSAPSNEAAVSALTGVGNLPPITALTVMPNHPNPFGGETELTIGLPEAGAIVVEVYDVTGRRVRSLEVPVVGAGWRTVRFGSVDDAGRALASGVYFYRVTFGGSVVTRKMVVAR